jgi:predicted metalloprotease
MCKGAPATARAAAVRETYSGGTPDLVRPSLSGAVGGKYGRPMPGSHARRICAALTLFAVLIVLLAGPSPARAAEPGTIAPFRAESAAIAPFLDNVLASVDTYWHETLAAAGRPAPSVGHAWVVPGGRLDTACGVQAGDDAAFYCPADDTIYVGQAFARALYDGVIQGLPGQRAGYGRAAGDFAVAYVVAHEYAHDVQQESGVLAGRTRALPTELNADCLAGTWARWADAQGRLDPGDLQEAIDTALAVGDFDVLNPQHHGTPVERRDALLTGLRSGSPSACDTYLQG